MCAACTTCSRSAQPCRGPASRVAFLPGDPIDLAALAEEVRKALTNAVQARLVALHQDLLRREGVIPASPN